MALLTGVDELGNAITASFDATATIAQEPGDPRSTNPSLSRASPSARARATASCAGAGPHPQNPRATGRSAVLIDHEGRSIDRDPTADRAGASVVAPFSTVPRVP